MLDSAHGKPMDKLKINKLTKAKWKATDPLDSLQCNTNLRAVWMRVSGLKSQFQWLYVWRIHLLVRTYSHCGSHWTLVMETILWKSYCRSVYHSSSILQHCFLYVQSSSLLTILTCMYLQQNWVHIIEGKWFHLLNLGWVVLREDNSVKEAPTLWDITKSRKTAMD